MNIFGNGVLLKPQEDVNQIAEAISYFMNCSDEVIMRIRDCAYNKWQNCFDASSNAVKFVNQINEFPNIKRVVLITEGYPYAGERSFLESEVLELLKNYEVTIVAEASNKYIEKHLDSKIENLKRIDDFFIKEGKNYKLNILYTDCTREMRRYIGKIIKYPFDSYIKKERNSLRGNRRLWFKRLWESMKYYAKAMTFLDWIERNVNTDYAETVFYTFWQQCPTLALCMLKQKHKEINLITRTHGYDLYYERNKTTLRQPFRNEMDCAVDRFFFICKNGLDYYLSRNGFFFNDLKYRVSYLGSRRGETVNPKYRTEDDIFRIVSCSSLIQLKRVDRIINALGYIVTNMRHEANDSRKKIEWIHIGDGPERTKLEAMAEGVLRNNDVITYKFLGKVNNDIIHEFYANNKVDCFITTSSTEGLPVSIMEALSYGIPIIAPDVGGIREFFEYAN